LFLGNNLLKYIEYYVGKCNYSVQLKNLTIKPNSHILTHSLICWIWIAPEW